MVTRDDGNEWYIDVTSVLGGTEIWVDKTTGLKVCTDCSLEQTNNIQTP